MRRLGSTAAALAMTSALLVLPAGPATSSPSASRSPSPSPSPTECPDPTAAPTPASPQPSASPDPADPCADDHGDLAESTRAVIAAQTALATAKADLLQAEAALAKARSEVAKARAAERKARLALQQAVASEQKTEREINFIRADIELTRDEIGEVARAAYRGGPLISMQIVLQANNPSEFADRVNLYQSVLRAEDAALAQMGVASADLVNREARLQALRELKQKLKADADRHLAAARGAEKRAEAAQRTMEEVVDARAEALAAAEQARKQDIARYQLLIATSGALASRLVDISRDLQKSKTAVQGTLDFARPGTGDVTSPFGPRFHPILKYVKLHTGTDIGIGDGYVYAADDGVVAVAEGNRAYGNMTIIDHGLLDKDPLATLYAHQSVMLVEPGDRVRKGDIIGLVGSTGYSTGPHIHFEVRISGEPTDPWPWLEDAPLPTDLPERDASPSP